MKTIPQLQPTRALRLRGTFPAVPLFAITISLAACIQVFGQRVISVLFYGPNDSTESSFLPTNATFTVASESTWRAMTTSEFANYDLIIIGDPRWGQGPTAAGLLAAYDTRNTWAPAVTGRIVVSGLDPGYHAHVEAGTFLTTTMDWLTKGPSGKTALYVSSDWGRRNLDFLLPFGAFSSSEVHADGITITSPNHPVMIGSTSTSLSYWEISAHSYLTYPASFSSLAIGEDFTTPSVLTGSVVVARDPLVLQAKSSGNELILSWPADVTGFTLQSTFQLTGTVTWMDVTNAPTLLGAEWTVTNTLSGSAQFYRMKKL
jgi:hypothetical protein